MNFKKYLYLVITTALIVSVSFPPSTTMAAEPEKISIESVSDSDVTEDMIEDMIAESAEESAGETSEEAVKVEAPETTGVSYKITASSLNVRSSASPSGAIVMRVVKGTVVTVTEYSTDKKWGKITYNEKTGWVSLEYAQKVGDSTVTPDTPASPVTPPSAGITENSDYKVTATTLNVRSGPGSSYTKVASVAKGKVVTVTEISSNNWGKITVNGVTGWISLDYTSKVESGQGSVTPSTPDTPSAQKEPIYEITASSLNVRSGAGSSYSKVSTVTKGQKVVVTEVSSNNWGRITVNGVTGWISLSYAKKISSGTTTATETVITTTTEVTAEATTENSTEAPFTETSTETVTTETGTEAASTETTTGAPSTEESTEVTTETTTEVTTEATTEVTTEVTTETTTEVTTQITTEVVTETVTVYVYKIKATSLNVRSGPGTSYSAIGSVKKDTSVTVSEISADRKWGKIVYNNKEGWIALDYATLTETKTEVVTREESGNKEDTGDKEEEKPQSGKTYIVNATSLNMRSGPGTKYSVIKSIPKGEELIVTEVSSDNWGKTNYNGSAGWVCLTYCGEVEEVDYSITYNSKGQWIEEDGTWCWYNTNNERLFASNTMYEAWQKIRGKTSGTQYYLCVNCTSNETFVFTGSANNWAPYKAWSCATGAPDMETVIGTFTISNRGYSFSEREDGVSYTCYYWTRFYHGYLFHSVLYKYNKMEIYDGRVGLNLSHGCVRLEIDNAIWIYKNCQQGTKVLTYN